MAPRCPQLGSCVGLTPQWYWNFLVSRTLRSLAGPACVIQSLAVSPPGLSGEDPSTAATSLRGLHEGESRCASISAVVRMWSSRARRNGAKRTRAPTSPHHTGGSVVKGTQQQSAGGKLPRGCRRRVSWRRPPRRKMNNFLQYYFKITRSRILATPTWTCR